VVVVVVVVVEDHFIVCEEEFCNIRLLSLSSLGHRLHSDNFSVQPVLKTELV
jgi:hypothetical protein